MRLRWLLAIGLTLFLLSRLPLLLASPDWGPFSMEHCFFLSVPGVVDALQEQFLGQPFSIASVGPNLFRDDFHGGSWWVGTLTHTVSGWIGTRGLLSLKLVSVFHALVAFAIYLAVLGYVWRQRFARVAFPVFVAWLAPPTMLLWSSLLLMGHYYETWFFHALYLPPLILLLQGRMPLWGMALLGMGCGLAVDYAFSNLVYLVLSVLLYLRFSARTLSERFTAVVAYLAGVSFTTMPFYLEPGRLGSITHRVSESGVSRGFLSSLAHRLDAWFTLSHFTNASLYGDGWSRRGLFSVIYQGLHRNMGAGETRGWGFFLACVVTAAALISAAYLFYHAALLLRRRSRFLDLGGRLIAAHGLLLLGQLSASVLFENPYPKSSYTSYKSICYAAVLFGLGQVLARISSLHGWLRWPGRGAALLLCAVFGLGWLSSATWNMRDPLRPPLERCDNERALYLANKHGLPDEADPPDQWVKRRCVAAFPHNEAFCRSLTWDVVLKHNDPGHCKSLPGPLPAVCAASWGRYHHLERTCGTYNMKIKYKTLSPQFCSQFEGELKGACLSGAHQGSKLGYPEPPWCQNAFINLCRKILRPGTTQWRACLQQTAWLNKGMGPFPAPEGEGHWKCEHWPEVWRGLCLRAVTARPPGQGETACEQVYLDRFARELPRKNSLLYEQCLRAEGEGPTVGLYPPCAIGVARITEGLRCRWDGRAWPE